MAQHDYVIANGTGAAVRSDLNNGLSAIVTQNSGATEPATTYAFMRWADTTAGVMKMRNSANNAWITLYQLDGEWTNIAFENGTAAAPSIYFKDSGTDTGFYSPGANQVGISTGGTARLTIDSNGNVDIDSNTLYVDATNNRVGLGTSSPSTTLSVAGGISGTAGMNISGAGWGVLPYVANSLVIDNNAGEARFFATGANATTRGSFIFYNGETDGGAGAAMVIDTSSRVGIGTTSVGHKLDLLVGGGADGINVYNNATGAAYYQLATTSRSYKIEATGSDIRFYDNTGSAERARIDSSGRLLVGTSSDVSGGEAAALIQSVYSTGALTSIGRDDTTVNNNDFIGGIDFHTKTGASSTWQRSARILCYADADQGSGDAPGRLTFSTTADGASSPTERMRIRADGAVLVPDVADDTTASAANVVIDSGGATKGQLLRSTSSRKYKTNIETLEDKYADALLNCRPVWYQSLCERDNKDWGWWGFIAEEVAEVDPRLCFFAEKEDGSLEPEGVQYDRFVPHLLNLIKRQGEAIAELQAEVAALKGA